MNQSSRTAEHMAFFRALESLRPPHQRLFSDPYAACFLSPGFRRAVSLASVPGLGRAIPWLADVIVPGARSSAIARTRVIDDALVAALAKGIRQVVILGAGFDCRALRIPELRPARIFEVDHPQTFATKRAHLAQFADQQPASLTFVQIDFNQQSLAEVLRQAGFVSSQRSVLLWEGVTNYLTADAVASVLATFPDPDPGRAFERELCVRAVLKGAPAMCVYASSTSTTEPFGLFATSHSISAFEVRVPLGLFGLQM